MKENSTAPKNEKKEKVGADGLTKKERRALKVAEKGAPDTPNVKDVKKQPAVQKPSNISDASVSKKERRALKVNQKAPNNISAKPTEITKEESKEADVNEGKSKALLRAERREIQEKQRLAKLAAKENSLKKDAKPSGDTKNKVKPVSRSPRKYKKELPKESQKKVRLFNHLYCETLNNRGTCIINNVHPTFIALGEQYSSKTIIGSNARCLALLAALKDLIRDFVTPPKQELCRSLESSLNESVKHLQKCRKFAVSMNNAIRHFKVHLTQLNSTDLSDADKKCKLQDVVDVYVSNEIFTAATSISDQVKAKISNNDVIVTYGCSSLIKKILIDSHQDKKFKVVVIEGRGLLEGREMLRQLVNAGIDCSYCLINSATFVMNKANKVLLGAHSLLANGSVMARNGSAQIALIAHSYNKPVLVCCETYKFCERVQVDSIVYNELGDPNKILNIDTAEEESPLRSVSSKTPPESVNLMYDVTPPDFVTAVVTELGFLPCTSVPVVLRIKPVKE